METRLMDYATHYDLINRAPQMAATPRGSMAVANGRRWPGAPVQWTPWRAAVETFEDSFREACVNARNRRQAVTGHAPAKSLAMWRDRN